MISIAYRTLCFFPSTDYLQSHSYTIIFILLILPVNIFQKGLNNICPQQETYYKEKEIVREILLWLAIVNL